MKGLKNGGSGLPASLKKQAIEAWTSFRVAEIKARARQVSRSVVFWLTAVNVAVAVAGGFNSGSLAWETLALNHHGLGDTSWYRLLGSGFAHTDLGHLVENMVGLLLVGLWLEWFLGKTNFLLMYTGSIFLASTFSLVDPNIAYSSAGASKGIFGMFACFAVSYWWQKGGKASLSNKVGFIACCYGIISILYDICRFMLNASYNSGHLGGLVAGFSFIGWTYLARTLAHQHYYQINVERTGYSALLILCLITASYINILDI